MKTARLMLSASELAALGVDGLPGTSRSINRLRERHGWTAVGDGNRILIDVASLPVSVRAEIEERHQRLAQAVRHTPDQAPRSRGRPKGSDFFTRHPDVADAVLAYLAQHEFAAPTIMTLLATNFTCLPQLRTLQAYIARIEAEKVLVLTRLRDPDRAKSKYQMALGRMDGDVAGAHDVWELDTTPADVMTAAGRKMILGMIDRFSRQVVFLIADSESAQSVRALMLKAILRFGVVPGTIVVDRGSGYINATVKTACELLDIAHKPCPPASGERKPFVERLFGTFTRQRAVLLDGFTGHNVAQAQQLRARARKASGRPEITGNMTPDELQAILDNWANGPYATSRHGGIGMAPIAKAMTSTVAARPAPPPALLKQMLTAFVGNQVVGKRGLRWRGGKYWCAELAAWIGRTVHVRRDEDDLGALLVFDTEGAFIGEAVDFMRAGVSERDFAIAARVHQRSIDKAQKAEVRELMKRYTVADARNEILRGDAALAGKLAVLPLSPRNGNSPRTEAPATIADDAAPATLHALPLPAAGADVAARVGRAQKLLADDAAGHAVDPQALAWAQAFVTGPAFRAFSAQSQPSTKEGLSA